jgi:hypothetical protein
MFNSIDDVKGELIRIVAQMCAAADLLPQAVPM